MTNKLDQNNYRHARAPTIHARPHRQQLFKYMYNYTCTCTSASVVFTIIGQLPCIQITTTP